MATTYTTVWCEQSEDGWVTARDGFCSCCGSRTHDSID